MDLFAQWLFGTDEPSELQGAASVRSLTVLEKILDFIEEGIIVHDDQRRIFLMNLAAEKITGWNREQALGRDCREVFPPDGICGAKCRFHPNGARGADGDPEHEIAFVSRTGEPKKIHMAIHKLPNGLQGVSGVLAVMKDVTEVSQLRWQVREKYSFGGMVGRSGAMREVFETIRQLTTSDYPVMITGESGTGKELVARAIHTESRRAGGPFVPINCGALPLNILESELFGHVRGAFTGAIRDKKGRFEMADGGTLFLDEVGELDPVFQVKLLRVLQEMRFEPVGGEQEVSVDVRIISATNRDLKSMVNKGEFRQDLFYRLCVVPVSLPPLRDRAADLPLLAEQVLESVRKESGKQIRSISNEAMDLLLIHNWPGNVRELINALQFASVRCEGETIEARHLPPELRSGSNSVPPLVSAGKDPHIWVRSRRGKLTEHDVAQALKESGGNKVKAAKLLGVGRATLYRFLAAASEEK